MSDMAQPHTRMWYNAERHGIYAYTSLATTSPRSFLYYVVAAIGPDKSHRPLAVAYRQGLCADPNPKTRKCTEDRVGQVIEDCMRLFNIFTEPSNRTSLEAELSLAASWYQGPDYRTPDRVEVSDLEQPDLNFSWSEKTQELPELPWQGGLREFPFISTCLRLALSRRGRRSGQVQEQPLGTVFRDDKMEYGMVVLDISDLNQIRYGIIGSVIKYMAEVNVTRTGDWDAVEDGPPEKPAVPTVEEPRNRAPLTFDQYLKKFSCTKMRETAKGFRRRPLISSAALEYIWPANDSPSNDGQSASAGPSNPLKKRKRADSLDRTIEGLIQGLSDIEDLNTSNIQQSTRHPEFQARLLEVLREDPLILSDSRTSTELLQLAYAGHSHLNWASYGNLSYESVAAAIRSNKLDDANALSLCIDRMSGSADVLFDTLLLSKSIQEINFLQSPMRDNDELGSQLFSQICASPSGSSLLRERKVLSSCAYSAPLQRKCWLPDMENRRTQSALAYSPPVNAFPVQHMFVRQQFVSSRNPKTFRPCYFFLGDALLDPERFAIGFLEYCRSVITDDDLLSFSCCPPTLPAYKKNHPGMRISPIASENFSIPRRCDVVSTDNSIVPDTQVECWPMVRDLEPGGWPAFGYESEVPFVRYAFLRARKHIDINDETCTSTSLLDEMVGPSSMEVVGGLAEFLRETAALDEVPLVNRLLADTNKVLVDRWPTGLGPGMIRLSTLEEGQARAIFRDFIGNTPVVNENLRMVMRAKPEEYKWYPELLESGGTSGLQPPPKSSSVFKSLIAAESQEVNPLGTETKIYEEPNEDDL
ncbi:hypothetical protein O1611_g2869 [Lasiodiplodia mahajangana]|uniref:Uncharacterized protein n=1 Tax=Lasiodiplodia mahajangana TaxID=1108764 RepID=A0ACC2JTD2_9PEZI|nr:hypothetical protein O1611_g2869 [Lasiodiplodia mahajangana]